MASLSFGFAVIVFLALRISERRDHAWELIWGKIAKRRWLCVAVAGVLPVVCRLCIAGVAPPPRPSLHDEFSHLLGADTFASGRLVNPAHPMRRHLETFHVQMEPTYITKYLPGHAAFLAVGQRFAGHPWYGVLIEIALMCSALAWMLYAWLPNRWALLGIALAVGQFALRTYWMETYWGGAVAAAGGALVLGAYRAIRLDRRGHASVFLGVGLVLLLYSRPVEGGCLGAVVLIALLARSWRERAFKWCLWPSIVLGVGVVGLAVYNLKATESALEFPYALHQRQYGVAPLFVFGEVSTPPNYSDQRFAQFWAEWEVSMFHSVRSSLSDFLKWKAGLLFYAPAWPQQVAVLLAPFFWRGRRLRMPALCGLAGLTCLLLEKCVFAHYAAPMAGIVALLYVTSLRGLGHLRLLDTPVGGWVRELLIAGWMGYLALSVVFPRQEHGYPELAARRAELEEKLNLLPGKDLVLVRYGPLHNFHEEWIYNRADIDNAEVVWARSLGDPKDAELAGYFSSRCVWVLDAEGARASIRPQGGPGAGCGEITR